LHDVAANILHIVSEITPLSNPIPVRVDVTSFNAPIMLPPTLFCIM
jgi:hypothetical protein